MKPSTLKPSIYKSIPFFIICGYILSQSFNIPLISFGPSWALWPNLADLTLILAVFSVPFLLNSGIAPSPSATRILRTWLALMLGASLSYVSFSWFIRQGMAQGTVMGAFHLYRLVQFSFIFWYVSRLRLDESRIRIIRLCATLSLLISCAGVWATYLGQLPLPLLVQHLPTSPDIAGPWSRYAIIRYGSWPGWGTVGYNHSRVAAILMLLYVLRIQVGTSRNLTIWDFIFYFITLGSCFISGARAGFACCAIFGIIFFIKYRISLTIFFITVLILYLISYISLFDTHTINALQSTLERQSALREPTDPDNLVGRAQIWAERIAYLNAEPLRWLVGVGFGSTQETGNNAHMLVLHIILETGIIGLCGFLALGRQIIRGILQGSSRNPVLIWATLAFIFTSVSQETFYPVPAFGHFIGLYMVTVSLSLPRPTEKNLGSLQSTSIARATVRSGGRG
jgi:hypothetical protein